MVSSARKSAFALALFAMARVAGAAPVNLRLLVGGLDKPVVVTPSGDATGRLFIAQQTGQIRVYNGAELLPVPFLDISSMVSTGTEQGLLGLAFHPNYETNGYFYVNFTDPSGDTRIVRFSVSGDPDVADPASAAEILFVDQPFANHNGGQLAFGPDGMLWIGLGDGGLAGDVFNLAQDGNQLLGKMLRIDVNQGFPYAIPVDNPFVNDPAVRDEIWARGLRNPWRFTFDRLTGDRFIADVGQGEWEEVNFEPVSSPPGRNYGWRRMEGTHCYNPSTNCNDGSLVLPVLEYSHAQGCSVTGGYRYRGSEMPNEVGTYFYGDFCSGLIWGGIENPETGTWSSSVLVESGLSISTFGEDERGELYVADLGGGAVYRVHGETFCSVQLDKSVYRAGDTVRATTLEVANLSRTSVAVQIRIGRETQNALVLPAGKSMDLGPASLFTVSAGSPPGTYGLECRFLDPATGELRSVDSSRFRVE
jgi:glucose/arabinose dehydrogenase